MKNYWAGHEKQLNINNRVRCWKKLPRAHGEEGLAFRYISRWVTERLLEFTKGWVLGVGTFWGAKSCKAHRAEVTESVIPCEAELAQVRASETPDFVMHQVVIIKLEQPVSRKRPSLGKSWCLSQCLGKRPKVQEY